MKLNRRHAFASLCSLLAVGLFPHTSAHAFSEDVCVDTLNRFASPIRNCMTAATCGRQASDTQVCRANVMLNAGLATLAGEGTARSMIHVDATHFLAQAAGLSGKAAYWIAAFNQMADLQRYEPFGMFGQRVETDLMGAPVRTPLMNGWGRSSTSTGGLSFHFTAPYSEEGQLVSQDCTGDGPENAICGQLPDLEDEIREGFVVQYRDWALGYRSTSCANGFSEFDENEGWYMDDTCYAQDWDILNEPLNVTKHIRGLMPMMSSTGKLVPFSAYSGLQVAQFQPGTDDLPGIQNLIYADEAGLSQIVQNTYGPLELDLLLDGAPLSDFVALVRMGIYLHLLQDRISHYQCGDTSLLSGPDENGAFNYLYNTTWCSGDQHAWTHFQEVGQSQAPERTRNAIEYTLAELKLFAQRYPQWKRSKNARVEVTDGSDGAKTIAGSAVVAALSNESACQRVKAMIDLVASYGFEQMPGNTFQDSRRMCGGDGASR